MSDRKIHVESAGNDFGNLGGAQILADPAVVEDLTGNRMHCG